MPMCKMKVTHLKYMPVDFLLSVALPSVALLSVALLSVQLLSVALWPT